MTYLEAKQRKAELETLVARASAALNAFPKAGAMSLTPDHVKASPAFQAAKLAYSDAFARLRAFNERFLKAYQDDIRTERRASRA